MPPARPPTLPAAPPLAPGSGLLLPYAPELQLQLLPPLQLHTQQQQQPSGLAPAALAPMAVRPAAAMAQLPAGFTAFHPVAMGEAAAAVCGAGGPADGLLARSTTAAGAGAGGSAPTAPGAASCGGGALSGSAAAGGPQQVLPTMHIHAPLRGASSSGSGCVGAAWGAGTPPPAPPHGPQAPDGVPVVLPAMHAEQQPQHELLAANGDALMAEAGWGR